jgi:hypothetical protein
MVRLKVRNGTIKVRNGTIKVRVLWYLQNSHYDIKSIYTSNVMEGFYGTSNK